MAHEGGFLEKVGALSCAQINVHFLQVIFPSWQEIQRFIPETLGEQDGQFVVRVHLVNLAPVIRVICFAGFR
jgi:hypothetical protein